MNTLGTAAAEAGSRAAVLDSRVKVRDRITPWLLLVATIVTLGETTARDLVACISAHPNVARLRANSQAGDQFVSWILVILAVIAIGLLVVAAVNGWFSGRIGQLKN